MKYLSILKCAMHSFNAVAIEDEDGSGHRLTSPKCCGSWTTVQRWPIDERMTDDIMKQLGIEVLT